MHHCYVSIGAGIYISNSERISTLSVPNNTALQFTSNYYCRNCRLSFYCLSNSTSHDYNPSLWYRYGRMYPNTTQNRVTVSQYISGLYIHNDNYGIQSGVYTCDIADSNGRLIQLSIGAYENSICKCFNTPVYKHVYTFTLYLTSRYTIHLSEWLQ